MPATRAGPDWLVQPVGFSFLACGFGGGLEHPLPILVGCIICLHDHASRTEAVVALGSRVRGVQGSREQNVTYVMYATRVM